MKGIDRTATLAATLRHLAASTLAILAAATLFIAIASPADAQSVDLAVGKPSKQSSEYDTSGVLSAAKAFDNDDMTRSSTARSDDAAWIQVDLQSVQTLTGVGIKWEVACGRDYDIQVSNDGSTWNTIKQVRANASLQNDLTFSASGRYVRMQGITRCGSYGYSIFSFKVFGTAGAPSQPPPVVSPPPAPFIYVKPPCMPNPLTPELRAQWRNPQLILLFYCDKEPRGIFGTNRVWYPGEAVKAKILSVFDSFGAALGATLSFEVRDLFAIDAAATTKNLTAQELADVSAFRLVAGLKATVVNTTAGATDAPLFAAKPDGTRASKEMGRVPINSECAWDRRLVTITNGIEKPTNYYAVTGEIGLVKGVLGYATCKLNGPVSR